MRQRAAFFDAAEIDHWLHSDFLQYMSSFFWLILVIPKCKNRLLDANERYSEMPEKGDLLRALIRERNKGSGDD